jgi:hypothetical protein
LGNYLFTRTACIGWNCAFNCDFGAGFSAKSAQKTHDFDGSYAHILAFCWIAVDLFVFIPLFRTVIQKNNGEPF